MGTVTTSTDNLTKKDQKFVDSKKRQVVALTDSKSALIEYDVQQKVSQKEQAAVTAALEPYIQKLRQQEALLRELQDPGRKYIEMLKSESATIGMTRKEAMMYQAAQLGVLEQATPLINAQFDTSRAFTAVEMSAKQTRQAMRLLPAQITDVVTSLASGMPMYLVAIQQGGQLRDSFGGFGNVMKGVASLINPVTAGIAVLSAVGGAAYYVYEQFANVMRGFEKTIISSGNSAGVTANQMVDTVRTISQVTGSQSEAVKSVSAVLSSNALIGQSYEMVSSAALQWSDVTGQSVEDVVKMFESLAENPAEAMAKLDKQFNFLTVSTYEQVSALIEQGKTAEASRVLFDAFAQTINQRSPEMAKNFGLFDKAVREFKIMLGKDVKFFSELIDPTLQQQLDKQLDSIEKQIQVVERMRAAGGNSAALRIAQQDLEVMQAKTLALQQQIIIENTYSQVKREEQSVKEGLAKADKFLLDYRTEEQKILKEIIDLNIRFEQAIKGAGDSTEKVTAIQQAFGFAMESLAPKLSNAMKTGAEAAAEQLAEYEKQT